MLISKLLKEIIMPLGESTINIHLTQDIKEWRNIESLISNDKIYQKTNNISRTLVKKISQIAKICVSLIQKFSLGQFC